MIAEISRLLLLMLAGNALIYSAFAFMNARFWPQGFEAVYRLLPHQSWRLLAAAIVIFPLANFLFAQGFRQSSAVLAGVVYIIAAVIGMTINALLLDGSRLSWLAVAGILLVMLGGILVVQGLQPPLPRP